MTSRSMMGQMQKHYVLLYFKWVSDYTPKVNKTNNSLFCLQTQYAAHNLCAAGGAIKPVTLTSLKPFHLTQEKKKIDGSRNKQFPCGHRRLSRLSTQTTGGTAAGTLIPLQLAFHLIFEWDFIQLKT